MVFNHFTKESLILSLVFNLSSSAMKKINLILSFLSLTLFALSIVFKWYHLKGAAVLLVAGVLLGAVFLISVINKAVKLPTSNSSKSFLLLGSALFLFISLSVPFNLLQWPYAKTMLILSYLSLISLVFLLFNDAWREKDYGRRLKKAMLAYGVSFIVLLLLYLS
jgi:hypothetical protein